MANNNQIQYDLSVNIANLNRTMQQVQNAFISTQNNINKSSPTSSVFMGMIGASAVTNSLTFVKDGFISAIGAIVEESGKIETAKIKWETLLGSADAADSKIKELKQFASSTPFEFKGINQASTTLYSLSNGALNSIKDLTKLGDLAAKAGVPIEDLSTTYGRLYNKMNNNKAFGEELSRMTELGIVTGDLQIKLEEMAKSGAKGSEMWKTFIEGTKNADGGMEKLSTSVEGMISTLKDDFTSIFDLSDNNEVMEVFKTTISEISKEIETLKPVIQDVFVKGIEIFHNTIGTLVQLAKDFNLISDSKSLTTKEQNSIKLQYNSLSDKQLNVIITNIIKENNRIKSLDNTSINISQIKEDRKNATFSFRQFDQELEAQEKIHKQTLEEIENNEIKIQLAKEELEERKKSLIVQKKPKNPTSNNPTSNNPTSNNPTSTKITVTYNDFQSKVSDQNSILKKQYDLQLEKFNELIKVNYMSYNASIEVYKNRKTEEQQIKTDLFGKYFSDITEYIVKEKKQTFTEYMNESSGTIKYPYLFDMMSEAQKVNKDSIYNVSKMTMEQFGITDTFIPTKDYSDKIYNMSTDINSNIDYLSKEIKSYTGKDVSTLNKSDIQNYLDIYLREKINEFTFNKLINKFQEDFVKEINTLFEGKQLVIDKDKKKEFDLLKTDEERSKFITDNSSSISGDTEVFESIFKKYEPTITGLKNSLETFNKQAIESKIPIIMELTDLELMLNKYKNDYNKTTAEYYVKNDVISSWSNASISIFKSWSQTSNNLFSKIANGLSGTTGGILSGLSSMESNGLLSKTPMLASFLGVGGIITTGLSVAGTLVSSIIDEFFPTKENSYDNSKDWYNTSRGSSSVVSSAIDKLYLTNNFTINTGYIGDEVGTEQFFDEQIIPRLKNSVSAGII